MMRIARTPERSPRNWNVQLELKLQDLWVGAFWKRTGGSVDVWVCLVPCVPLHISWWHAKDPVQ